MAKQKTGGQKKGTPNKITTDVRAEGTTRAAPAAAPSAGGLGPQYFGLRTMVLQDRRTPVQVPLAVLPLVTTAHQLLEPRVERDQSENATGLSGLRLTDNEKMSGRA